MAKISDKVIERIRAEAASLANPWGLVVHKVEYLKEDGLWYLRVTVDHAANATAKSRQPVTIEDCSRLHRPLSRRLDELDLISSTYYLEVASPGSQVSPSSPEATTGAQPD